MDELLGEISNEVQRQAQIEAYRKIHNQRQLRKRILRAQFAVSQNEPGWQINGEIQGFGPENLNIEVTNEHTLKVTGDTQWQSEKVLSQDDATSTVPEQVQVDKADESTLAEAETASVHSESDNESHKSYQATVEDDFEDLGAETASMISASSSSSTSASTEETKNKENVTKEPSAPVPQNPSEPQAEESEEQERQHGSFERIFKFPERIDAANVRASFKDGVLSITVPRAPVQQPKTITIL